MTVELKEYAKEKGFKEEDGNNLFFKNDNGEISINPTNDESGKILFYIEEAEQNDYVKIDGEKRFEIDSDVLSINYFDYSIYDSETSSEFDIDDPGGEVLVTRINFELFPPRMNDKGYKICENIYKKLQNITQQGKEISVYKAIDILLEELKE